MAIPVVRWLTTNLTNASTATKSASSSATSNPVSYLGDALRSKKWRSATGWTIVSGWNDRIDFNRGGVKAATITAGTYATGAALSAAIVTALTAADATPTWACAYSGSTFKFTISTSAHAFTLLITSGTNVAAGRTIFPDTGYTGADLASTANACVGIAATYQSRAYIAVDQASAVAFTASALLNHNGGASAGTATLQWSATSVAVALSAPTGTLALTGDTDIRIGFVGSTSMRYVVVVLNFTSVTDGYTEAGWWFLGTYTQLTANLSDEFQETFEEASAVTLSDSMTPFLDEKPRRRTWTLGYRQLNDTDRALMKAITLACPMGKCFILCFDATITPTNTVYVYFSAGLAQTYVPASDTSTFLWATPLQLAEALG